jgi:pyrroline-5-carboxylate reductase
MRTNGMADGTIVMVGCGRMGGAILRGLQAGGPHEVWIVDPAVEPSEGVHVVRAVADLPPLVGPTVLLAVKPQVIGDLLPELAPLAGSETLILSIVAGLTVETLCAALGDQARVVRAMPNTPAAVMHGVTAALAGPGVGEAQRRRADALLGAIGEVVWLEDEALIDAVTAVSGSGPAYFFRFAEALSQAGRALGLPPEVAERLARRTLEGAGALAASTDRSLAELRAEVTSPGGTTAAGLARLDAEERLQRLVEEAADAARTRSRELGRTVR